jgi:hypothetical protein
LRIDTCVVLSVAIALVGDEALALALVGDTRAALVSVAGGTLAHAIWVKATATAAAAAIRKIRGEIRMKPGAIAVPAAIRIIRLE